MAIYSFSTKDSRPTDAETIDKIRKHCESNGLTFSRLVIKILIDWYNKELANGQ